MLSLFFFSFFASSRNYVQTEGYNTHLKWSCFSLFIYFIVKYEGDLSIIIINAKDRKSTRLNSSHVRTSRMPSSA